MIITDLFESRDACRVCGQTPCNCTHIAEGEVVPFKRAALTWQKLPRDVLSLANDWFWADYEGGGLQATMDPKGLGSSIANQQKYLGAQLQQRGWAIDFDDEFENVVLKNRQGQTVLLPIEDAQDFTGWAQGTNPVNEQGVGNIGASIKALYKKIYRAGDDEIEYFYNDSPIFAQYWDEYEGDLDSIVAEVDPAELQIILDELESYVEQAGLAEGEVKAFPKKHRGDLESTHSCVKCGGDLQGGTYMGHRVKVCVPCKQVYLPPNSGIDQQGNKINEQGVAEGSSSNLKQLIQQYEDMVENVYGMVPGARQRRAIEQRDALEARIEALPGGKAALSKWARAYNDGIDEGVAEADNLPGIPVVSLKDFGDKDNTKDKYGRTVPKKLKKDDPRVKFHKDPKQQGVAEMDSQGYKGTRDEGDPYAKGSKATPVKAKDVVKQGVKALNKAHPDYGQHEKKLIGKMSNAEKVDKGWRNPNIDEVSDDTKFVGFMNKAMANKVDTPKADPLAKAPDWYKNAPAMNFDAMPSHKKALQFGLKVLSKLDPETKQQLAAGGERAICDYIQDVAERTLGSRGTIDFVEEDIWECQDYLSNVFHDPDITSWVDVLKTGLNEVSDQTLINYMTKVDADARKHRADPTKRSPDKRDRSVAGFARAFNKLDARKEKTDEDAVDDFLARGGQIQQGKLHKPRKGERWQGSSHIGAAGGRGSKGRVSGMAANTNKGGKPVVTAEALPKAVPNKQRDPGALATRSHIVSQEKAHADWTARQKALADEFYKNHPELDDRPKSATNENSMADELARMAMKISPRALVRKDGEVMQHQAPGPKPAGNTAPRPAPRFDPEAEYADDYSAWHRRTHGVKESTSLAEAWARRYPNLHADIAECQSSGDASRLKKLMAIKSIIDSDLNEQSGLGFGQ